MHLLKSIQSSWRSLVGAADTSLARMRGGVGMQTTYHFECFGPDGKLKWEGDMHNLVVTAGCNKLLDATFKTGLASPAWYVGLIKQQITDAAITSGAAALTSASNPWVSGDAGSDIIVRGAGASGADLLTTILSYSSAGAVTLAANAGTTVTGAMAAWEPKAADTAGSHADFTESTDYSESVRQTFTPGSISSGSVDNSASKAVFSINGTVTLFGAFLTDLNTKGGTTGVLYGGGLFSSPGSRQMASGDTLNVTVTLTAVGT